MKTPVLGAVVLAGGAGLRFGTNKLLADFMGKPLYRHLLDMLPLERFHQTVVVTRYPEIALDAALRGCTVGELEEWETAQSHSIRCGLSLLGEATEGAAFFVCDQPLLRKESVERLADDFLQHPHAITALGWEQQRGNPVLFPRSCFAQLYALSPRETGGAVIGKHLDLLRIVQPDDPCELWDIDTPADFYRLQKQYTRD